MIELQDWQKPLAVKMADVLKRQRMFLCSATTGAGKTYLASAVARELGMPTLVVCPKVAISQWKSVIAGMGVGDGVIGVINQNTTHGATEIRVTGAYEDAKRTMVYSVISGDELRAVRRGLHEADPKAFINVMRTDEIQGRFLIRPND